MPPPFFRRRKPVPQEGIEAEFRPYGERPGLQLRLEARVRGTVLDIAPQMMPKFALLILGILSFGPIVVAFFIFSVPIFFRCAAFVIAPLILWIVWKINQFE